MDPVLLVLVVTLATLVACCGATVRMVPAGHTGVVLRAGRPARTRPSGLALVFPGVERLELVPGLPPPIAPFDVTATTRDGVSLRLSVSLAWAVRDPIATAQVQPDVKLAVADAFEREVHHLLARFDLTTFLRDRGEVLARLAVLTLPALTPLGVELLDVDLLDVEVRVGPELLRLIT